MSIFIVNNTLNKLTVESAAHSGSSVLLIDDGTYIAIQPPPGINFIVSRKDAESRGIDSLIPENIKMVDDKEMFCILENENPLSI